MPTPRFPTNYSTSDNSPQSKNLILKCQQDPIDVVLVNPTYQQLEVALSHVEAPLHPSVLEMLERSLKDNTPIDRATLSRAAETSQAVVEERTSTVWLEGHLTSRREIVIRGYEEREEDDPKFFDPRRLLLSLTKTDSGDIEASLSWEDYDCSECLDTLIARWKRVDDIFTSLHKAPPPWDLLPHAQEKICKEADDKYAISGLRLLAFPVPPEVILGDPESPEENYKDGAQKAAAPEEEDDEPFFAGNSAWESENQASHPPDEEAFDDNLDPLAPQPGDDLTIIDPTPFQLSKIARLSSMPLSTAAAEQVLNALLTNVTLTAKEFKDVSCDNLCIQTNHEYALNHSLSESRRMRIEESDLDKPVMFSISLHVHGGKADGSPIFVRSTLHWEQFAPDVELKNWRQILKIARSGEPGK